MHSSAKIASVTNGLKGASSGGSAIAMNTIAAMALVPWRPSQPKADDDRTTVDIHWCWIKCSRCLHMRAVTIASFIIRWGPDGWQDMLRRAARCTNCGQRGLELQHPSWDGSDAGWASMPISQMAPVPPA